MAAQQPAKKESALIKLHSGEVDDNTIPLAVLAADSHLNPDHRLLALEKRRARDLAVFPIEGEVLASLPRPNHWSIAWSDLMMTMFVLFFIMFVHEIEHARQLNEKMKILAVKALHQPTRTIFLREQTPAPLLEQKNKQEKAIADPTLDKEQTQQSVVLTPRSNAPVRHPLKAPNYTAPDTPKHISDTISEKVEVEKNKNNQPIPEVKDIYAEGLGIVRRNRLESFAAINIAADNTIHLVLTGDLLFPSAQATLTSSAKTNLLTLADFIAHTPYIINIEGHTDDQPIASRRFPSNWELSLARANSVARFLIKEADLNPQQLVISGYASYRPVASNKTEEGRAQNRRVEIILSPATSRIKKR